MSENDRERTEAAGRWTRRDERRRSERERMKKHGASLRRVYLDAVLKRMAKKPR